MKGKMIYLFHNSNESYFLKYVKLIINRKNILIIFCEIKRLVCMLLKLDFFYLVRKKIKCEIDEGIRINNQTYLCHKNRFCK